MFECLFSYNITTKSYMCVFCKQFGHLHGPLKHGLKRKQFNYFLLCYCSKITEKMDVKIYINFTIYIPNEYIIKWVFSKVYTQYDINICKTLDILTSS